MSKFVDENGVLYLWSKIWTKAATLFAALAHRHDNAATGADGFMSAADKTKLDGIAAGANAYTHPTYQPSEDVIKPAATPNFGRPVTVVTGVQAGSLGHLGALEKTTINMPSAVATTEANGLMSATDKAKLDGVAANANNYVHPDTDYNRATAYPLGPIMMSSTDEGGCASFSVNGADFNSSGHAIGKIVNGFNILLPKATSTANGLMSAADKTKLGGIAAGANAYTHPTTTGNKHIPSGGSSGQFLKWSADGTAVWAADNNTTYSPATSGANGLMSSTDKAKLDAFGAASTYALKSDITSMYKHKGSVAALANLPTTGNAAGDVYNLTSTGMNYVWTGSAWDALGQIFSITSMTNAEIDAVCV